MSSVFDFCPLWGTWEIDRNSEPLGKGSYGTVWKAHRRDAVTGDVFYSAIKHISIPRDERDIAALMEDSVFSNRESAKQYYSKILESLVSEIKTMYSLRGNTNIVSYEDHMIIPKQGTVGYDLFIRMELLKSLPVRLKEGQFQRSDVIKLGMDISKAIEVLNSHSYVHRDIKPQNIFVNDMGDYKLGDYGTARILDASTIAMTKSGTPAYMAPEIYKCEQANNTVDIYSLGIVMYRLMNGNRLPFTSLTAETISPTESESALIRRIRGDRLPSPAYADAGLAKVILKACAYSPSDRYQSGLELYDALKALQTGKNYEEEQTLDEETIDISVVSKSNRSAEYAAANQLLREGKYDEAVKCFTKLGDYNDSYKKLEEAYAGARKASDYQNAIQMLDAGKYSEAVTAFKALGGFRDSNARAEEAAAKERLEKAYAMAESLYAAKKYNDAAKAFQSLNDYKDSEEKAREALEKERQNRHKKTIIAVCGVLAFIAVVFAVVKMSYRKPPIPVPDPSPTVAVSEASVEDETANEDVVPAGDDTNIVDEISIEDAAPAVDEAITADETPITDVTSTGSETITGDMTPTEEVVSGKDEVVTEDATSIEDVAFAGDKTVTENTTSTENETPIKDETPTETVALTEDKAAIEDETFDEVVTDTPTVTVGTTPTATPTVTPTAPPTPTPTPMPTIALQISVSEYDHIEGDIVYVTGDQVSVTWQPDANRDLLVSYQATMEGPDGETRELIVSDNERADIDLTELSAGIYTVQVIARSDLYPEIHPQTVSISIAVPEATVEFNDASIQRAVMTALRKADGAVYERELQDVTSLNLRDMSIKDISDLALFSNLSSLDLANNEIEDIAALAGLYELESLDLGGNSIQDISALSKLKKLKILGLADNAVSDISVLSDLTDLKEVYLNGNPIEDISSLGNLKELEVLNVNGAGDDIDLAPLSGLTKLREYEGPQIKWPLDEEAVIVGVWPDTIDDATSSELAFEDAFLAAGVTRTGRMVTSKDKSIEYLNKCILGAIQSGVKVDGICLIPYEGLDYSKSVAKAVSNGVALHVMSDPEPEAIYDEICTLYGISGDYSLGGTVGWPTSEEAKIAVIYTDSVLTSNSLKKAVEEANAIVGYKSLGSMVATKDQSEQYLEYCINGGNNSNETIDAIYMFPYKGIDYSAAIRMAQIRGIPVHIFNTEDPAAVFSDICELCQKSEVDNPFK